MASSQTFQLFPQLPKELRLRIWEYTAQHRVVEIIWHQTTMLSHEYFTSDSRLPSTLQVCRESRCNNSIYAKSFVLPQSDHYVWVNFDMDIFQISDVGLSAMEGGDRDRIRNLILVVEVTEDFLEIFMPILFDMKDLEDVNIISMEGVDTWGMNVALIDEGFQQMHESDDFRKSPTFRIIDNDTGEVITMENYARIAMQEPRPLEAAWE